MNSRVPRSFGPPQIRAALFRVTESGGVALNIPVTAEIPGQLAAIGSGGGVRLRLGEGAADEHLEPSDSGGIRIQLTP